MSRTLSFFLVLGVSFGTLAAACSSSGSFCDRTSKCSAEPKTDTKACQAGLMMQYPANCQKQAGDWLNCVYDHEVCTMDNKHDQTATLAYAATACKDQKSALDGCVASDGGTNK